MKNYLTLNRFSLLYDQYAFIDVPAYYADQLFIRHQVTVRFGKEYRHPDQPYVVIFCKVRKQDRNRFLSALSARRFAFALALAVGLFGTVKKQPKPASENRMSWW